MKKYTLFLFLLVTFAQASSSELKESKFQKWLEKTTEHLDEKGKIINTALGPVQIVTKGKGTPIIVLHGGFGGWDQGVLVANKLYKHGFKVIIPSRPGYLSTPIFTDPLVLQETTPAAQADLMKALLDALHIPRAIVLGFSAGAPVAYEFGLRHPDSTISVVLESIGANPNEDGSFYALLGLVLATQTEEIDYATYLFHLSLKKDFYSSAVQFLPLDTNLTGQALNLRNNYILDHHSQYHFFKKMFVSTIPLSPRLLGTLNDFLGVDYWTTTFTPPVNYSLPTMIIQAINDSNGFYPTAQSVHSVLPTSQLISVPESGHFIWLSPNTHTWQKQLIAFLKAYNQ